jgi:hypothetical protein
VELDMGRCDDLKPREIVELATENSIGRRSKELPLRMKQ